MDYFFSDDGERVNVLDMEDDPIDQKIWSLADALWKPSPQKWVIQGLISEGSVSVVAGFPGTKKSYAMLTAAMAVASGLPWIGFTTHKGPVLVIDQESGTRRLIKRLEQVLNGMKCKPEIPLFYTTEPLNLRVKEGINSLDQFIKSKKAKLVVIDALADIMPGADENTVKDVGPVFLSLRKIAEDNNCAIVIIHHANKSGDYRGSTSISASVDLLVMVTSNPNSEHIQFKMEKARDIEALLFAAKIRFSEDAVEMERCEAGRNITFSKEEEKVVKYLTKQLKATMPEILTETRVSRNIVSSLTRKGVVQRLDEGGKGVSGTYGLVATLLDK